MLRLINLDELEKDTEWDEYFDGYTSYSSTMIDEAEIVEAIPVEYIKDTIKLAERVQANEYAEHLKCLLEDWERENAE